MTADLKKTIFYTILVIFTLGIILISGELIARIFVKENTLPLPPPLASIDPYAVNPYMIPMRPFLFFHIPGSKYVQARSYYSVEYNINSMGFRGPDIYPKKEGEHRFVVIGDSIIEGHGNKYKDTFSYRLGEKAKEYNWDVINMGVQGASPLYFAANIKRYLAVDPDAVLIVMFENDLYEDRIQERTYFEKPDLDKSEYFFINKKDKFFLSEYSKLWLLLKRTLNKINHTELEKLIVENLECDISNEEQEKLNKLSPWLVAPSIFDKQWHMTEKYMDYTINQFELNNIPVYFAFISLGALTPGINNYYALHAETFNEKVAQWAESRHIPFYSFLPVVKKLFKELPPEKIIITDDGHPTPETHKIIEDHLWNWIMTPLAEK